jgi:hypothetical protein
MKNLSIAFLAAVSLMSFAGCKKKGGGGDMVAKMTEFKDAMCKCADKACADKVSADMATWSANMAKEAGDKPVVPSEEDAKKMAPVSEEFGKCMAKAMTPAMAPPPAAPDKPADPAAPAGDKPADPAAPPAAPAGSAN